jgi:hypothetical protein
VAAAALLVLGAGVATAVQQEAAPPPPPAPTAPPFPGDTGGRAEPEQLELLAVEADGFAVRLVGPSALPALDRLVRGTCER